MNHVETAAQIIDPDAFLEVVREDGCGAFWIGRRAKARSKAKAIISAAYLPFIPDRAASWPPSEYAPSGKNWLVIRDDAANDGKPFMDILLWNDGGPIMAFNMSPQARWRKLKVLAYTDPVNVMPEFVNTCPADGGDE